MAYLRALVSDHRKLAGLILSLSLIMKVIVPAGFMLGNEGRVLTVEICTGVAGEHLTQQVVLPADDKSHSSKDGHDKAGEACPFTALAMGAVSGADVTLLQAALVFIILCNFVHLSQLPPERTANLRPPLRGPPVIA